MTTKFADPVDPVNCNGWEVSPPKLPLSVYVAAGSPGVMGHEAVPVASVVAVHVSVPLSVKVTGSLGIGGSCWRRSRTPDTVVWSE